MFDVAIIGAGLAGLVCAQQLHQAGYHVVILEKSRGVGGRLATRRLHNTCVDHGVRYLEPQGMWSERLIQTLLPRGILQVWADTCYELKPDSDVPTPYPSEFKRYIAPSGMTAIAKFLATGLDIWHNQRVQAIALSPEHTWHLTLNTPDNPNSLQARAVVVAIPAPQALMLLEPLASEVSSVFLNYLRSVQFDPCLSVMAGYLDAKKLTLPTWNACTLSNSSDLAWIGLDSRKRLDSKLPIFVLQSTAQFAQRYLDTDDLIPAGQQLLSHAAQLLMPGLETADWVQVHRWRYAFPTHPFNQDYLDAETSLPLICCGDWCGGNLIESALHSGFASAEKINQQLQQRELPKEQFLDVYD